MERPKWVKMAARTGAALGIGLLSQILDGRDQARADPQVITKGNENRAEVALTLDCGGPWVNVSHLNSILDAFDEYEITATFYHSGAFIDGYAQKYPEVLERLKRHESGNHGYDHLNHTQISEEEQRSELRKTKKALEDNSFADSGQWRPPFGARIPRVAQIAEEEGYPLIVMWTTDSGDWIPNKPPEVVKATVLSQVYNGSIFVMHCNSWQTAQVLPDILSQLKEWGIKATTINQIIRNEEP